MSWTAGADVSTGDLITAAQWNNYLGASGSVDYLKAKMPIVWKASPSADLSLSNQTSTVNATTLDLTAVTSADATFAILMLQLNIDSVNNGYATLWVRKNGDTPAHEPALTVGSNSTDTGGLNRFATVIIGMDSGQVIEYGLIISGTIQVDVVISVLGYMEW